jgi:hypothetical protein
MRTILLSLSELFAKSYLKFLHKDDYMAKLAQENINLIERELNEPSGTGTESPEDKPGITYTGN